MYRLVVDVELSEDRDTAKEKTRILLNAIRDYFDRIEGVEEIVNAKYRLQLDSDRVVKNHYVENENGHVGTKKAKVFD